jgi:hypothetical protein
MSAIRRGEVVGSICIDSVECLFRFFTWNMIIRVVNSY